ncbi:MAG: helix-turn-helix domain-containing protein [Deltaproteobacteria bacterium]|nr:helix-turn-helix domain-containing protein [Deltaproteobacteria bacterium]MBW2153923.1 helix-turn-helix domain-containing protein [Deltaproteobacteria bacterium]
MTQLIEAKTVAARLGVPVSWVRKWTREGRIRCVRLGKYVRYDPVAIEDFVHRHEKPAAEGEQWVSRRAG